MDQEQQRVGVFFVCISYPKVFLTVRLQKEETIKINLNLSRMNFRESVSPQSSYTSRVNTKYFKWKLMNFATFPNLSFPWSQHSSSVYRTFCFTDPLCLVFQVLLQAWFKFLMRRSQCLDLSSTEFRVKAVSNKGCLNASACITL